jgi:2'-5' RNA ligase
MSVPGGRWVVPENWHLTLKFLGSVYPRLRDWVGEQVAATARTAERFETRLTALGAFPSARRARVLWVGLDDSEGRFKSLAAELDRLLEREFDVEKRPFTAHLTVARLRDQVALDDDAMSIDVGSEPFTVDALTLYRSHLQRPAPRYEPVREFPLYGR